MEIRTPSLSPADIERPPGYNVSGTTPAGGIVSEEPISMRAKTRWHKLTAFFVTVAALVAVAIVAINIDNDAAAMVYASMAGATVTALIAYITGNVKEHTVVAGLGGMATALLSKLSVPGIKASQ